MPKINQVDFSVRIGDGEFGQLIIEAVRVFQGNNLTPDTAQLLLDEPPTKTAVLEGKSEDVTDIGRHWAFVFTRPWISWFYSVYRALKLLLSLIRPSETCGPVVLFTAWSVREIDADWYAEIPNDAPLLFDHTTFTPDLVGFSRFGRAIGQTVITDGGADYVPGSAAVEVSGDGAGAEGEPIISGGAVTGIQWRKRGWYNGAPVINITGSATPAAVSVSMYPFAPGQYVLINDENANGLLYAYEIIRIVSIDYSTGVWTIERGQLGTEALDHVLRPDGGQIKLYLLIPGKFQKIMGPEPPPQNWKFLWDNMAVCVVQAQILSDGAPVTTQSQFPTFATVPARPGRRSMGGAAYINLRIDGDYEATNVSNKADAVQSFETLRHVHAKCDECTSDTVVHICWIDPQDAFSVWVVATVTIAAGATSSGLSEGAQMPSFEHIWPPNMLSQGAALVDGVLQPGQTFSPDPDNSRLWSQDGYFQAVVQEGTGRNLRVVVQT